MARSTTGQRVQAAHQEWYVTGAATAASYAAVDLSNGERTTDVIGAGPYVSLECYATAATQNAKVKIQVRTTHESAWRDLHSEVSLTAGTLTEVYSGVIRAGELRVVAKYDTSGATVTAELCLK